MSLLHMHYIQPPPRFRHALAARSTWNPVAASAVYRHHDVAPHLRQTAGRATTRAAECTIVGLLPLVPVCAPNDDAGHGRDDAVIDLASVGAGRLSAQPTPGYGLALGLTFTRIEPGTFRMGSTDGQADERPTHTVTLSQAFELGTHEVTQAQWFAVMETTPADQLDLMRAAVGNPESQRLRGVGDDLPMYLISWTESRQFVDRLSRLDTDYEYRLPTETEWEYAARAGTAYSFGDDPGVLNDYAWFIENANLSVHPVGSKRPNPWGLYDMHATSGSGCPTTTRGTRVDPPSTHVVRHRARGDRCVAAVGPPSTRRCRCA